MHTVVLRVFGIAQDALFDQADKLYADGCDLVSVVNKQMRLTFEFDEPTPFGAALAALAAARRSLPRPAMFSFVFHEEALANLSAQDHDRLASAAATT